MATQGPFMIFVTGLLVTQRGLFPLQPLLNETIHLAEAHKRQVGLSGPV